MVTRVDCGYARSVRQSEARVMKRQITNTKGQIKLSKSQMLNSDFQVGISLAFGPWRLEFAGNRSMGGFRS